MGCANGNVSTVSSLDILGAYVLEEKIVKVPLKIAKCSLIQC